MKMNEYYLPGGFSNIESIWITWAIEGYNSKALEELQLIEYIKEIARDTRVNIIIRHEKDANKLKDYLSQISQSISFFHSRNGSRWLKDRTFVLLLNRNNSERIGVAFSFYYPNLLEKAYSISRSIRLLQKEIARSINLKVRNSPVRFSGGMIESNGMGLAISIKGSIMEKNPSIEHFEIDLHLKNIFNLEKIIWFEHGLAEDEFPRNKMSQFDDLFTAGSGGHIDNVCRFIGPYTILFASIAFSNSKCRKIRQKTLKRLAACKRILEKENERLGNPFQIIEVPAIFIEEKKILVHNSSPFVGLCSKSGNIVNIGDEIEVVPTRSLLNFRWAKTKIIIPSFDLKEGKVELQSSTEYLTKIIKEKKEGINISSVKVSEFLLGGGGLDCLTFSEFNENL